MWITKYSIISWRNLIDIRKYESRAYDELKITEKISLACFLKEALSEAEHFAG
jgi:hypothetical protein